MGRTIEISELIELIRRRRSTLLLWVALALGAGAAYLRVAPPAYLASARVLVQRFALPSDRDSTPHGDREFLATQAEILRSPQVLRQALKALPPTTTPPNEAIEAMLRGLTVTPVVGTDVLSLTYRCPDPQLVAATVEAMVSSYRQYVQRTEREAQAETLRVLRQTEAEYEAELGRLGQGHLRLRTECPALAQGPDGAAVQRDLLTHLGHKLNEAKNRRIDLENQFQTLRRMPRGAELAAGHSPRRSLQEQKATEETKISSLPSVPSVQDSAGLPSVRRVASAAGSFQFALPAVPVGTTRIRSTSDPSQIQEDLWRAQARTLDLEQTYGPRHPDLRAARQQVESLEGLLRDCVEDLSGSLDRELQAVSLNETELARLYDEELRKLQAIDRYRLQDEQLQGEIARVQERRQEVHNELRLRRMDNQLLSEGRAGIVAQVLEYPAEAEKIWPRPRLVLIASLLSGLLGAIVTIAGAALLGSPGVSVSAGRQLVG